MINVPKKQLNSFCKKHHIAYLGLFGSVLKETFSPKSDVDILVRFKKEQFPHLLGMIAMESELSAILGKDVDLKTPDDLSPYFREDVIAEAKTLYGK